MEELLQAEKLYMDVFSNFQSKHSYHTKSVRYFLSEHFHV